MDYVSAADSSAVDKALGLAAEITLNGKHYRATNESHSTIPSTYSSISASGREASDISSSRTKLRIRRVIFYMVVSCINSPPAGLDFERAAYEPLLKTNDRVEALEAFKEKRALGFKGE